MIVKRFWTKRRKAYQSGLIDRVRTLCRNIDEIEESINKIRQSQSSDDNYETILGIYEREHKRHIDYLSGLLTANLCDK